jgi:hypothetical protein
MRILFSRRRIGVAVRRAWVDTRPAPHGDCANVIITDGSRNYAPQTPVYVLRGMRAPEGFEEALEQELELLAGAWPPATRARELAAAVEEDRLIGALEEFGLGNDRGRILASL